MHACVCDQIIDLVQNALEAGADDMEVRIRRAAEVLEGEVRDNGCGMSAELQARALDPFYSNGHKHRRRRVGLGLAFLKQMVEATGGRMDLKSVQGTGTTVWFALNARHLDMPPEGDWAGTVTALMAFDGEYELLVARRLDDAEYSIRRSELALALGELQSAASLALVRAYAASQEEALMMRKGTVWNGNTDT